MKKNYNMETMYVEIWVAAFVIIIQYSTVQQILNGNNDLFPSLCSLRSNSEMT
jgi:hypothetical protein